MASRTIRGFTRRVYTENYRAVREALRESKRERDGQYGIVRVLPYENFGVEVVPVAPAGKMVYCWGALAEEVALTVEGAGVASRVIFDPGKWRRRAGPS